MKEERQPLRIGVVGTNFVSDWLVQAAQALPQFSAEPVQVTAVYSRAQATGDAFAARHGIPLVFTDYEAMLHSPQVDAVYIASPNVAHCAQALAAAAAGKHILCEKVIAVNGSEFAAMRAAAEENGVVLMEAMRPVYDPALALIREALPGLGPLRRVSLEYCQYSSRYPAFLAGQRPNAFDPTLSNAAIMDIGVYCVAVCAALFGAPQRLHAAASFLENGFEAGGSLLLQYSGFQVQLSYSKITESVTPSVFQGEQGSLTVDKISVPRRLTLQPYRRTNAGSPGMQPAQAAGGQALPYTPAENNMVYELAAFARLVRQGCVRHPGLEVSAVQMAILDEARRQNGVIFPADRA